MVSHSFLHLRQNSVRWALIINLVLHLAKLRLKITKPSNHNLSHFGLSEIAPKTFLALLEWEGLPYHLARGGENHFFYRGTPLSSQRAPQKPSVTSAFEAQSKKSWISFLHVSSRNSFCFQQAIITDISVIQVASGEEECVDPQSLGDSYLPALPPSRPSASLQLPLWSLLRFDCSPPLSRRLSPTRLARMSGLLGFNIGFRGFPSRASRPRRLGVAIARRDPGRLCGAVRDPAWPLQARRGWVRGQRKAWSVFLRLGYWTRTPADPDQCAG